MTNQNSRWQPTTLREIVGLFALPIKKPPDCPQITIGFPKPIKTKCENRFPKR
ncbi:TPA: hypothetical protein QFG04_001810 [Enterococcus faecium]|uniref:hypothetical protein n=1 Tax=Enterococcus faecium TaxID=1352 RepID=UPI00032FF24C|nr:hypothetical protein [Enterococcus faecium]EOF80191.1 hypothetical protein SGG_00722 [Enterococcus faecium EnGen0138]EOK71628.1 hypothetical protein SEO_01107 [Enterococcus faecium EnGen0134]EME8096711.1 hypothetical protein [Enterococcus faecium]EOF81909.1 hypothetical protein SGE_00814 [Enterococcus faecium EnGen0137]EOK80509.1 hypothetical protein SI1_00956 [Enterococcus faecium EnGen0146]